MDFTKLSRSELLQKCNELGLTKCKSKNKTQLISLIQEKLSAENEDIEDDDNENNEDDDIESDGNEDNEKEIYEDSNFDEKIKSVSKDISNILKKFPKKMQTKLTNIDKAGVDTNIPCTTKRVSQNSRIFCTYSMIRQNNLTLPQLNTHSKGICIGMDFNDYSKIKNNVNNDELDEYLLSNIGGDKRVSSIISIMKDSGYSGSKQQRDQKLLLDIEAKQNNWAPISRKKDIPKGLVNEGNDKWEGHYYFDICGGDQESFKSWTGEKPQIFTTPKGFMSGNKVIRDNYVCLLYMLLHVHDINIFLKKEEIEKYKLNFEKYMKERKYQGKTCYDLISELEVLDKDNNLISPISWLKISAEDFCEEHKLNISHNEAVCKQKIYFCENNNIMLSDYRPGNLFWDFKVSNMQQQDYTIKEYWQNIEESLERRKLNAKNL